ncbi:MAG: hypothetical protein AB2823_20255 [Candidatus Thiodiazotropha endolucinida]
MSEESESEEFEVIFVAREAVGHLRRLSRDFPHLATQPVRVAIDTWNEEMFQKGELVLVQKQRDKAEQDALEKRAIDLIEENIVDDVLDQLNRESTKEIDYYDLIDMVGKDRYIEALTREAVELKVNAVSSEQAAELWNNCGKPTVGGERWTATGVSVLMGKS